MLKHFKMATKIVTGVDALSTIQTLSHKRVLIVCDPSMERNGTASKMTQLLQEKNVCCRIFSEIIPDPTIDVVTKGLVATNELNPDAIIALGGGSAIDTAKVIRYMYAMVENSTKIQLICIPTTSGTGSEVTSFAVISDPITQSKYALVDDRMIPDFAILDPTLTVSVPKTVTADTGIDVLTHCMEALASTAATDFTDAASEKAMKIIWQDLVAVVRDGKNLTLRERIHNASCLAGIAFNEASLGICHSLAHALGGKFHIPHGRANALLLPHVIRYNAGLELEKELPSLAIYQKIAAVLGFQGATPKAAVHGLINGLNRQLKQLEISNLLTDQQIDLKEFQEAIPEMAMKAMQDKCTLTNPRKPTQEDLEQLYKRLLRGGSVCIL